MASTSGDPVPLSDPDSIASLSPGRMDDNASSDNSRTQCVALPVASSSSGSSKHRKKRRRRAGTASPSLASPTDEAVIVCEILGVDPDDAPSFDGFDDSIPPLLTLSPKQDSQSDSAPVMSHDFVSEDLPPGRGWPWAESQPTQDTP